MANYNIYDKNGTLRYAAKAVKFSASFMQVATLTVTVKSALPIAFAIGDYIDYSYDGLRYTIRETPTPKKVARYDTVTSGGVTTRQGLYGEAFQYELVFKSALWELKNCQFKDYVLNEQSGLRYTSLPDVSTYENPTGIKNRILANVNKMKSIDTSSISTWAFKFHDTDGSATLEAKDFSLSNGSCLDAMAQMYELWKISFRHIVENVAGVPTNTIVFSKVVTVGTISTLFKYGLNQGLKALKKTIQNGDEIYTRIFAFGSTKNLLPRYYNTLTNQDGTSLIADTMYIPNLMLPPSSWGTKPNGNPDVDKAYYYDPNNAALVAAIAKYGIRPKAIYFDGTDGREDIYPSLKAKIVTGTSITDDGTTITGSSDTSTIATVSEQSSNNTFNSVEGNPYVSFDIPDLFGTTLTSEENVYLNVGSGIIASATAASGQTLNNLTLGFYIKNSSGYKAALETTKNGSLYSFKLPSDKAIKISAGEVSIGVMGYGNFTYIASNTVYSLTVSLVGGTVVYKRVNKLTSGKDFTVNIGNIGFNIADQAKLGGGTGNLSMLDGHCGGWNFPIKSCTPIMSGQTVTGYTLVCSRQEDNTLGMYYPNKDFQINANDNYTLTDIVMPSSYIEQAEQRLLNAVANEKPWEEKFVIEPEIDNIKLVRSPQTLSVGMWMQVLDDDLELGSGNTPTYILIDSLAIDDSGTDIPKFSVTLRDEKPENTITKALKASQSNADAIKKAKKDSSIQGEKQYDDIATKSSMGSSWGEIIGNIDDQADLKEKLDERPTSELFKRLTGSFVTPPPASEMQEGDLCFILTNVEAGEE